MSRAPTSGAGAALVALVLRSSVLRAVAAAELTFASVGGIAATARRLGVSRCAVTALGVLLGVELPRGAAGRPADAAEEPADQKIDRGP